jgi:hypothetical protein
VPALDLPATVRYAVHVDEGIRQGLELELEEGEETLKQQGAIADQLAQWRAPSE